MAVLVTRQVTGNLKEVFVPLGQTRLRQVYLSLRADGLPVLKKDDGSPPTPLTKAAATPPSDVEEISPSEDTEVRNRQETGMLSKRGSSLHMHVYSP